MSALASEPLAKAGSRVRALPGAHETSRALFWSDGEVWVEMIAGGLVSDELGRGHNERAD